MEIKEIVTYFLNEQTDVLDVTFRTNEDSDDTIRTDKIDFLLAEEYGFNLIVDNFDFLNEDFDEDLYDSEQFEIDEYELISFLNEYYMLNPDELPKPEIV